MPYLNQLGISHIYASPIFQARKGSSHGYDITDPNEINFELGGKEAFEEASAEAFALGLDWLFDIVPNHAAYSPQNKLLNDVLEKGVNSAYSGFFDVDWNHPSPKLKGKLLAPFLPQPLHECLKQKQVELAFNGNFKIRYSGLEFPVNASTTTELQKDTSIEQALQRYNTDPNLLGKLLSKQKYSLAEWKTALKHINYRRFFDIVDLIGLQMENAEAFEQTHRLIFDIANSGAFSGLRIDHIDGLNQPEQYLQTVRKRLPNTYLLVEKILTDTEQLPASWPIEGTTGYDFLNAVNKVFVQQENEPQTTAFYGQFTGNTQAFSNLLYNCKRHVVKTYFLGDARNLTRVIIAALTRVGYTQLFSRSKMVHMIVGLLSCFPIYRTYLSQTNQDDKPFRVALIAAADRMPHLLAEFSAITHLLDRQDSPQVLYALMRFQQFTGAVMAKGFEDTLLYRYNRLLSLNEVGSNPSQFGCSINDFHRFNQTRQQHWPLTLNATSTHDTKRGEDVRARLNVLSEIPQEFQSNMKHWKQLNVASKQQVNGKPAPKPNEEYYLYQTLLGAYPWNADGQQGFASRVKLHMVKALREAKANSSWLTPNTVYEEAVGAFTQSILENPAFLEAFLPLQQTLAYYGALNSLSQTLLKIACPGVPDFYQGTELWDLNLVDPDNRRPVDFHLRQHLLSEVNLAQPSDALRFMENFSDGKAKLYTINKALAFRRKFKTLFDEGEYLPLKVKGRYAMNMIAFCRKENDRFAVVVVPRFLSQLKKPFQPWRFIDWANTDIALPSDAPISWANVFTLQTVDSSHGLAARDVLGDFPVALLFSGGIDG